MCESAEETLVQIHPKCLQVYKVRPTDTLHNVVYYTIHLRQQIHGIELTRIDLTLKPLSLSSFFSNSKCLSVLVKPLYTKYSFTASSKALTAEAIAARRWVHYVNEPTSYCVTRRSCDSIFMRSKQRDSAFL